MPWTASGIYAYVLQPNLVAPAVATSIPWTLSTNKFYMTNNSDTPAFATVAASDIYAVTNEVSGTGWAAGGVATSALAAGSADIVTAWTVTGPGPTKLVYGAANVSVAGTTLASPGAFGGYFYWAANATKYAFLAIYFGGTGYITTAGTFAITWSGGQICTIQTAA